MNGTGAELILQERLEQLNKHNISVASDITYNTKDELTYAAIALISKGRLNIRLEKWRCPPSWNKDKWEHMMMKPYEERLILAGAFLAAEYDRIKEINKPLGHGG